MRDSQLETVKRRTLSTTIVVLVIVGSAALLSGCRGDGETETTSASAVKKAQFIDQANAVCKEVITEKNALIKEVFNQFKKENKKLELEPDEAAELAEKALPPVSELPDKLRALEVPEGDEAKVEALAQSYEDAVAEMEEDPGKIYAASYPFREGDELAEKYGLTVCKL